MKQRRCVLEHGTFFLDKTYFLTQLRPPPPVPPACSQLLGFRLQRQTVAFTNRAGSALSASSRPPALPMDGLEEGLLALRPFHFNETNASFMYPEKGWGAEASASVSPSLPLPETLSSFFEQGETRDGAAARGSHNTNENAPAPALASVSPPLLSPAPSTTFANGGRDDDGGGGGGFRRSRVDGIAESAVAAEGAAVAALPLASPVSIFATDQEEEQEAEEESSRWQASVGVDDVVDAAAGGSGDGSGGGGRGNGGGVGGEESMTARGRAAASANRDGEYFHRDNNRATSSRSRRRASIGWSRGRSASRGSKSRSRSRSPSWSRSRSPSPCGRASPPTMWGGNPISPCLWEGGQGINDFLDGEGFGGDSYSGGVGGSKEYEEDGGREDGGAVPSVSGYFRTADGRSLFAETLGAMGTANGKGPYCKNRWEGGKGGLLGDEAVGISCGKDGERDGRLGLGLGLEARLRRGRIDARSRDDKRREETMSAQTRVKRLQDEVSAYATTVKGVLRRKSVLPPPPQPPPRDMCMVLRRGIGGSYLRRIIEIYIFLFICIYSRALSKTRDIDLEISLSRLSLFLCLSLSLNIYIAHTKGKGKKRATK